MSECDKEGFGCFDSGTGATCPELGKYKDCPDFKKITLGSVDRVKKELGKSIGTDEDKKNESNHNDVEFNGGFH